MSRRYVDPGKAGPLSRSDRKALQRQLAEIDESSVCCVLCGPPHASTIAVNRRQRQQISARLASEKKK